MEFSTATHPRERMPHERPAAAEDRELGTVGSSLSRDDHLRQKSAVVDNNDTWRGETVKAKNRGLNSSGRGGRTTRRR